MKKLFLSLIIIFSAQAGSFSHPLHLSITNISIEGQNIIIRISTYADDWETAYFHYYSKVIDMKISENHSGEWFNTSLSDALKVMEDADAAPVKLITQDVSFEDLSMTIEMHGMLRKAPKSLYIYNSILTDIFPDQTNLVIISLDGKETGMKFDYKTKQKELKLR